MQGSSVEGICWRSSPAPSVSQNLYEDIWTEASNYPSWDRAGDSGRAARMHLSGLSPSPHRAAHHQRRLGIVYLKRGADVGLITP